MAITDILQQIISARYGKDVRQAIHDGIQQCYNDGKAGVIDLEARQGIQTLENEIAELQKFEVITETTSTTQPNSYAGRENILEIGGVTEQDSTAGNQLLELTVQSTTNNGITATRSNDNILLNGTSSGSVWIDIGKFEATSGQTYTVSANSKARIVIWDSIESSVVEVKNGGSKSISFVATSSGIHNIVVANGSGVTFNNEYLDCMVNAGNTALPWEKFSGGQPAPNPSYPMEIKHTAISGIKSHGKNFVNHSACVNGLLNHSTGVMDANGSYVTTDYIKINGDITISSNAKVVRTCQYDKDRKFIRNDSNDIGVNNDDYSPKSRTLEDDCCYIRLTFGMGTATTPNALFANYWIQVEEGTVATEYEPYTESVVTFSQPIDLFKKDGLQDILKSQNVSRKFRKLVCNGSENWKASSSLIGRFFLENKGGMGGGKVLCTHAKGVSYSANANECYISNDNAPIINTNFATVDEWKAHLASNPMTVVYELATETTEELPIADQIGLNSLATYDGITYVEFDSEIQPTFKAEYGTSKVGGYTLESLLVARNNELRISALE